MSRVGKLPVVLPSGVSAAIANGAIQIKGAKGQLTLALTSDVDVKIESNVVLVSPVNDSKRSRSMWGTTRANINNMVKGVTDGFSRTLEVKGVGFKASVQGELLALSLGFSHEVRFAIPQGIEVKVDKQTIVTISGVNKQLVGQLASEVRALRKPEPYKGKGVRYAGEYVPMKEGKKK